MIDDEKMDKLIKKAADKGQSVMSMEHAVWRLTGEQGDWLGIDAGHIREGDRADLVILDPAELAQNLEQVSWAEMENFGLQRLVNRNPGLVRHVFINGRAAVSEGDITPELGKSSAFGSFLPAQ